jgi:hypothetical protein
MTEAERDYYDHRAPEYDDFILALAYLQSAFALDGPKNWQP